MASSRSLDVLSYALPVPLEHVFPSYLPVGPAAPASQHEHKYLPDAEAARSVWAVASAHLRALEDPARPIAYVRTTYFDTPDLTYYRSARGPVARRIRVREYASATAPGEPPRLSERCFLELKESAGGQRSKLRLELEPQEVALHLENHPDAPLAPVLTTWYRRRSLADAGERLRVTLDEEVCFCAPTTVGSPCADVLGRIVARGPAFVLEVKRWADAPPWLGRTLGSIREAVGFSKFSAGMLAVAAR
jgi:hypothetical protein